MKQTLVPFTAASIKRTTRARRSPMISVGATILVCAGTVLFFGSCKSSSPNPTSSDNGSGIGPSGGTVTSADGTMQLVIPAGALSTTQSIAITRNTDSNTCPQALGAGYSLTPNGLTFSVPVLLTLHYDTTLRGANAEFIGVAYQDDKGDWYGVTGGTVDTIHRTVTVPISHFSHWSANLSFEITPSSTVVFTGTSLTFEVDAYGSPASDPAGPPVKLANLSLLAPEWKVSGVSGGNTSVGTITTDGARATYTAPLEMPSPNLVTLSSKINANGKTYVVPAFVHVIARNWTLTGVDSLVYSCPNIVTYTDISGGYLDFQLETGDYSATAYPWYHSGSNGTYHQAICPTEASSVASFTINRGDDMNLSGIASGGYIVAKNQMFLRPNGRWRDLPGYDVTFTSVLAPVHVAIFPGTNYKGALIFNNLSSSNTWVDDHSGGAFSEHITWTLTAHQ